MGGMTDLRSAPVPPGRPDDHVRGAGPSVVVYGDLACPRCGLAWTRVKDAPLRLTFRHFALKSKHPRALALAHAAEAAAAQGAFWPFVDAVYADQGRIDDPHLWAHAERLGLDVPRFDADRRGDPVRARVARDVTDALRGGITATPTFVVSDTLHPGPPAQDVVLEWAAIRIEE